MELIYANEKREDIGALHDYSFDLAYGKDENNFELTLSRDELCCKNDYIIYIENTEYGGIIDEIGVNTNSNNIVYKGRSWHGVLNKKVICPEIGQDYLIVSGDANEVLGIMITRLNLSDLFVAESEQSGINISQYQFERYTYAYDGFRKMLASFDAKLKIQYRDGRVVLSAVPLIDYTKDEQFDSDKIELDVNKKYNTINHIICLGKGELKDRQVIHLYADKGGKITKNQSIYGINEMAYVHDYPNAESMQELEDSGIEKFKEFISDGTANIDFDAEENVYDIGDIVGNKDNVTGIYVSSQIVKKIVTVEKELIKIKYEVGE